MMTRIGYVLIASCAALGASALAQAPIPHATDKSSFASGRDVMLRVCSGCHTPELVEQQRLAPADWKILVSKMADQGAVASEAELEQITVYLSKTYPQIGQAVPKTASSPLN